MTRPSATGGGSRRETTPGPRCWSDRLDDPDEPLYTVAVTGDLLGLDSQALRRLEEAISQTSARPSGNQRRYSRRDIALLAAAAQLVDEGYPRVAIGRILDLERQLEAREPGDQAAQEAPRHDSP